MITGRQADRQARTSPRRGAQSRRIARGALRRGFQPAILGVDDGEVGRVDDVGPDFQLDRVVAARGGAVGEAVDQGAIVGVASPGVGAVVCGVCWRGLGVSMFLVVLFLPLHGSWFVSDWEWRRGGYAQSTCWIRDRDERLFPCTRLMNTGLSARVSGTVHRIGMLAPL